MQSAPGGLEAGEACERRSVLADADDTACNLWLPYAVRRTNAFGPWLASTQTRAAMDLGKPGEGGGLEGALVSTPPAGPRNTRGPNTTIFPTRPYMAQDVGWSIYGLCRCSRNRKGDAAATMYALYICRIKKSYPAPGRAGSHAQTSNRKGDSRGPYWPRSGCVICGPSSGGQGLGRA